MIIFAIWAVGAIITTGYIGGVRPEMDGIGDTLAIMLWPIYFMGIICSKIIDVLYGFGQRLKNQIHIAELDEETETLVDVTPDPPMYVSDKCLK